MRHTYYPARYHGRGQTPPFFEGWYFKVVDAAEQKRLAIIPGIFLSNDPTRQHSFIQVLDGLTGRATYHRYPAEAFWAAADSFLVRVGQSEFSARGMTLNIQDEQLTLRGKVAFEGQAPWPITPLSPGIMGPFGLLPIMECYHGVVSLDHALGGELLLNGERLDFTHGRGYIEKDWGQSFPAGYVWAQTNHFHTAGTSFVGSIAIIPWLGTSFPGFIIGLWHKGQLHRFATYTGAKTETLAIRDDHVNWTVRNWNKTRRLHIRANRAQGGLLLGPTREEMSSRVGETMLATIELTLTAVNPRTNQERLLFQGTGRNAGLEVHGDLARLLEMQRE